MSLWDNPSVQGRVERWEKLETWANRERPYRSSEEIAHTQVASLVVADAVASALAQQDDKHPIPCHPWTDQKG